MVKCDFILRNLKYFRVIIAAGYSVGVINGIYGFMSWVDSIDVVSQSSFAEFRSIYDGIYCIPTSTFGSYTTCNEMGQQMANMTSTNTEWQCSLHTDSIDLALYNAIPKFKHSFMALIFSSIIYGIFACIHDCCLIRYDLNEPSFHPTTRKEFRLFCFTIDEIKPLIASLFQIKCNLLTTIILFISFPIWFSIIFVIGAVVLCWCLLMLTLDALWMLCFYPFVKLCYPSLFPSTSIHTLAYISSSWVAISRLFMVLSAYLITATAVSGIQRDIPPLDPMQCNCSCVYVLEEIDFYKIVFITCLWMALSAQFFWQWFDESVHLQDFYYLITFSLPAKLTKMINPIDPTGSMVNIRPSAVSGSAVTSNCPANKTQFGSSNPSGSFVYQQQGKQYGAASSSRCSINLLDNCEDGQHCERRKKFNEVNYKWRLLVMVISMSFLFLAIIVALLLIANDNTYHYPEWLRITLSVASMIALFVFIGFLRFVCKYKEQMEVKAMNNNMCASLQD